MTQEITIPVCELKAISLFSPKTDVRYYLNAVAINRDHVTATNGVYMAALPVYGLDFDTDILIPINTVNLFFKGLTVKDKNRLVTITLEGNYSLCCGELEIPFTPIDGVYPNWKKTIPEFSNSTPQSLFKWDQVIIFQKAAKILGYEHVHLIPNGSGAAKIIIDNRPDFIGVVMPACICPKS